MFKKLAWMIALIMGVGLFAYTAYCFDWGKAMEKLPAVKSGGSGQITVVNFLDSDIRILFKDEQSDQNLTCFVAYNTRGLAISGGLLSAGHIAVERSVGSDVLPVPDCGQVFLRPKAD